MKPTVIPAIFQAKDEMSKTMNKMQSNMSRFASDAADKFDKAGKNAFRIARQSAMVGVAIAAPLVVAAKSAVDFEEKMSNVATLIDTNKESISAMGDSVLNMATKLPVPIEELTTSLYDIRSAGITAEKQFETLESAAKLSAAGLSTVAEATNISTSALNAFRSEGLSAAQTNDILFKTVKYGKTTIAELSTGFGATAGTIQSAGVTLADFSAATAALTTVGTPATQAQTQLRAAIVALQKPTKEMEGIFKKLGVTSEKELIAREGGMVGAFDAINKAGTDMGLNLSKAWSSTEAVAAVNSVTGATKDAYLSAFNEMKNGPEALGEAFNKQGGTAKAQMQTLKNNAEALSITVGNALLPVINDLVTAISPYIKQAGEWIRNNKGLVSTIVKVAAGIAGFALAVSAASFVVGGFQKAIALGKIAMAAFNLVASLNPIGLIAAGLAAAAYAGYEFSKSVSLMSAKQRVNAQVGERVLSNTIDQRVEAHMLFNQLRQTKTGTDEYRATLEKINSIQPGIIEKYNLQAGALKNINAAEKELIGNIMERARVEATQELLKEKMLQQERRKTEGLSMFQKTMNILAPSSGNLLNNMEQGKNAEEIDLLSKQVLEDQKKSMAANPAADAKKDQNLKIEFTGLPDGVSASMNGKEVKSTPSGMMPKLATNL